MKSFGYVRVSTLHQEDGYGPEVQERAIRDYVEVKKLGGPEGPRDVTIVHESFSGETIHERKEFVSLLAEVRELARAGEVVHLIFFSSDRLSRDLMGQETVVAASFAEGFRLHSTRSHEADLFDPAYARDPMRIAIRQFFGVFNQLDKAMIRSRLDGGLYAKAATGGSTGGRYPFGYQSINGEITPCPEEVPVVVRTFELLERRYSPGKAAVILRREFPRYCGHWNKNTIKRIRQKESLYRLGRYRSRYGVEEVDRPELILAPMRADVATAPPHERKAVDAEALPETIGGQALAIVIGRQVPWIKAKVMEHGMFVRWDKNRMIIPKETAKALVRLAEA